MALLDDIRDKIAARQYEYSKHAVDQTILRTVSMSELEEAILNQSEVIEDYPEGKYGPSCLILGFTKRKSATSRAVQLSKLAADKNRHGV